MSETCGGGCRCGAGPVAEGGASTSGRWTAISSETVASAVRWSPRAADILRGFGIDICCGGGLTLAQAAASAGIPVDTVLAALDARASNVP